MSPRRPDEVRDGVDLTNLDQPVFEGACATKRELVDYLDGVAGPLVAELRDRPLSVIRATPGQPPFMQKNLPKYAPEWVARVPVWAEAPQRTVEYPLCNDRRTLLWFANQRAVEYHPALVRAGRWETVDRLVVDLDPPEEQGFAAAAAVALVVREALRAAGLDGAAKTSGAKGVHVVVPLLADTSVADAAAATRALAQRAERLAPDLATIAFLKADRGGKVFVDATRTGSATVVAAYSPRARPGLPVSFPVAWSDLEGVAPSDFTLYTARERMAGADPWAASLPAPLALPPDLVAEGHGIPVARVAAMHEGRRRARARRDETT